MGISAVLRLMREFQPIRRAVFLFSGTALFLSLFYCSRAVKVISVTVGLLNSRPFMG